MLKKYYIVFRYSALRYKCDSEGQLYGYLHDVDALDDKNELKDGYRVEKYENGIKVLDF